jgi:hypothetical protein
MQISGTTKNCDRFLEALDGFDPKAPGKERIRALHKVFSLGQRIGLRKTIADIPPMIERIRKDDQNGRRIN